MLAQEVLQRRLNRQNLHCGPGKLRLSVEQRLRRAEELAGTPAARTTQCRGELVLQREDAGARALRVA